MVLLNKLLLMFAVAMFASNESVKNLDEKFQAVQAADQVALKQEFARFAHNQEEVISAYNRFEEALKNSGLAESEIAAILNAAAFAAQKHEFQTRKNVDQDPYIIHPIGVAMNILTIAKVSTPEVLMAALLHDTVEDTATSPAEIREKFGNEVESYVQELTDDKELPKETRKELQIINASHKSNGASLIKLSDKLYNLTDLSKSTPVGWTEERVDEYFVWAKNVVDQLPPVSPELKTAVDQVCASHWEKRELSLDDQTRLKTSDFAG